MSTHFKEDPKLKRQEAEEEDDPVTQAIKKTGCLQLHFNVQECMYERRDWRACKDEVNIFRDCMAEYQRKTQGES